MRNRTKENFQIVFMGTPDFAVESLKSLHENGFKIIGVITSPDKPAGRGKKIQESAVKKYALENELRILQPTNLKNGLFLSQLAALKADLQVVVAFRMLPELVWAMPKYGTINLHASLLPNYRGAAPINHAIMNGETKTGITTFFIEKEIDTGKIIFRKEVEILPDENAGQLHDKLMYTGGELIVKTVDAIIENNIKPVLQKDISLSEIKSANKIFKPDCEIDWNQKAEQVYNFIRGLSPYPTAWFKITNDKGKFSSFKVFSSKKMIEKHAFLPGKLFSDNKSEIKVSVIDGFLILTDIQLQGKKRMPVKDLLNGFDIEAYIK